MSLIDCSRAGSIQAANDVLVDALGVAGVEDAAFQRLGSAGQDQVGDGAARRNRDDHAAFHEALAGVAELQPVARDGGAVADVDVNLEQVEMSAGDEDRRRFVIDDLRRKRQWEEQGHCQEETKSRVMSCLL